MQFQYEHLSKAFSTKFLTSQADSLILAPRPSNSYGTRFVLGEFSVHNRSGSTSVVGIGGRLPTTLWTAGHWDDSAYAAGTVFADDTTDWQDAGTGDFLLGTTSVNDDGILISCAVPFNIASIVVGTASSGGSPAFSLHYSIDSAGTGFSSNYGTITNPYVAPLFTSTGEQLIWFEPPTDWAPVTAATGIINRHGATVPAGYAILVKQTTAGSASAGLGTLGILGRVFLSTEGVADNQILNNIGGVELALPPQCDAICAAISTANPQNRVSVSYRYSG
jgi:hypothetical protein